MTTKDLIDRIVSYFGNTEQTDAFNTRRRARILEWAQEVSDEFWHHRPWPWRLGNASITVPDGVGYVAAPTDLEEVGPFGGVYDSLGRPLDEASYVEVTREFKGGQAQASPNIFAIAQADSGVKRFYIPKNSGAQIFAIYYSKTPPTLVDASTSHNLDKIPAGYHYTIMLAGVKARAARSSGDARADEFESLYVRNLQRATIEEKGRRSATRRLPRAIANMW